MRESFLKGKCHILPKLGKSKHKGKVKQFFAKLSRGLMLPIAILPIAGLLLGIGGAIGANLKGNYAAELTALIFDSMSNIVFATLPILFCVAITITFSRDKGTSGFCSILAYLVFCSTQLPFIQIVNNEPVSIMWFHKEIVGITTTTLGMPTLQTSIFGGVIIGAITSFIYNRVSQIKLPQMLDFFSGIRLVPIVLIPVIFLVAILFLIFWPWIGQLIFIMGKGIQNAPAGTGGLLYGILGRALMPFGLHHIPIVLAFQTSFGGILTSSELELALTNAGVSADVSQEIMQAFNNFTKGASQIEGDQNIWNFINSLPYNTLTTNGISSPLFEWFYKNTGVYAGRYTQDYPTYLGLCMGIGAALIMTSDKSNRKNVAMVIGSSMGVAFLTGITEPLEFTFLFCAPWLYYLVYVPLSGFSYMFMELCNAHVGVGFARGFIDLIIYGAIPVLKGTNFYWAFVLALAEGIFIYIVFYLSIKKFDLATPGRKDNPMVLVSKKDYQNIKDKSIIENKTKNTNDRIYKIIEGLGGEKNIVDVSACATRLRVTLNNVEGIIGETFAPLGSKGFILKGNGIQLIFGGEASIISDNINDILSNRTINDNENKDSEYKKNNDSNQIKETSSTILSPFNGEIIPLSEVPDELFSSGAIGKGIAIKPSTYEVMSILENGNLMNIFDSKHAYTFEACNGAKVLLHLGIDSVSLKDNPFLNISNIGKVSRNTHILSINKDKFKKAKSEISPIVIPEWEGFIIKMHVKPHQKVKIGDPLFTIKTDYK